MVKGISRRVIVVRAPDPRFFEQAVFFLREDALHQDGVTAEQVVSEAKRVAAGYIRRSKDHPAQRRLPAGARWCALGAAAASVIWALRLPHRPFTLYFFSNRIKERSSP